MSAADVVFLSTLSNKIRLFTRPHRPSLPVFRRFFIPRPFTPLTTKKTSSSKPRATKSAGLPPIAAYMFFDGTEAELAAATDVVLDFPGGGFICMGPEHHEERLRRWARKFGRDRETGEVKKRVVISVDYGKSPECQYELVRNCFEACA